MAKRGGFPGGAMPGNMANLMKQAQKMQRQMEEQQYPLPFLCGTKKDSFIFYRIRLFLSVLDHL